MICSSFAICSLGKHGAGWLNPASTKNMVLAPATTKNIEEHPAKVRATHPRIARRLDARSPEPSKARKKPQPAGRVGWGSVTGPCRREGMTGRRFYSARVTLVGEKKMGSRPFPPLSVSARTHIPTKCTYCARTAFAPLNATLQLGNAAAQTIGGDGPKTSGQNSARPGSPGRFFMRLVLTRGSTKSGRHARRLSLKIFAARSSPDAVSSPSSINSKALPRAFFDSHASAPFSNSPPLATQAGRGLPRRAAHCVVARPRRKPLVVRDPARPLSPSPLAGEGGEGPLTHPLAPPPPRRTAAFPLPTLPRKRWRESPAVRRLPRKRSVTSRRLRHLREVSLPGKCPYPAAVGSLSRLRGRVGRGPLTHPTAPPPPRRTAAFPLPTLPRKRWRESPAVRCLPRKGSVTSGRLRHLRKTPSPPEVSLSPRSPCPAAVGSLSRLRGRVGRGPLTHPTAPPPPRRTAAFPLPTLPRKRWRESPAVRCLPRKGSVTSGNSVTSGRLRHLRRSLSPRSPCPAAVGSLSRLRGRVGRGPLTHPTAPPPPRRTAAFPLPTLPRKRWRESPAVRRLPRKGSVTHQRLRRTASEFENHGPRARTVWAQQPGETQTVSRCDKIMCVAQIFLDSF